MLLLVPVAPLLVLLRTASRPKLALVCLLLWHFFEPQYQDFYKYFREREPLARVGYSVYVYRVDPR
jgi:hypothetical protein